MWSNVVHLISLKPWTGWGWGELDHAHFVTLYPTGRFCEILDNAHNLPLHLAVELGIPFALTACAVVAWLVLRARPWRETAAIRRLAWAVLALIGLHSLLEYPLWYGPFQIAALLAVWFLWSTPVGSEWASARRGQSQTRTWRPTTGARAALALAAASLLIVAAYALWDYHRVSQIYLAPALRDAAYRDDTLRKIQGSWLFRKQVAFAALTTATVTADNARAIHVMAEELLHFSPESRVIEKLIESAAMLGLAQQARDTMQRYQLAFPADYAQWQASRPRLPGVIDPPG